MQLKRLVLHSKNYIYVYHSGGSLDYMHFMGMTREAFEKAKGTYDVTCFVSTNGTYESTLEEVKEEFSLDKKDRNISTKVTIEQSTQCAKEFYEEVLPKLKETFNGERMWVLFKKKDIVKGKVTKGILYKGEADLYMIRSYMDEGLKECDYTPIGVVEVSSEMLLDYKLRFRNIEVSLLERCKVLVDDKSEYGCLEFINSDPAGVNDLISICNVNVEENYKKKLENLLKDGKPKYVISYGTNVYFC